MRRHGKLPPWVPRLTRGQRVLRNLTAAVIALLFTWAVCDFPAPTLGLAARWQAARYGLPAPEVLYCADESGGDAILQWEDGRLAITKCYSGLLNWVLGDFWFTEPRMAVPCWYQICTIRPTGCTSGRSRLALSGLRRPCGSGRRQM